MYMHVHASSLSIWSFGTNCRTAGDVSTSATEETFTSKKEGSAIASQTLSIPAWSSLEELE